MVIVMVKICPICNFETKSGKVEEGVIHVNCHECGKYMMDQECANNFRTKYLSFDLHSSKGRELYKQNLKVLRLYAVHHGHKVLTDNIVESLPGMYRPYPFHTSL